MLSGMMNHALSGIPKKSGFGHCQKNSTWSDCFVSRVKFGAERIMVWGSFSGPVVLVTVEQTFNASASKYLLGWVFVFQDDCALMKFVVKTVTWTYNL